MCGPGPLLGITLEYLDGFARQHYKDVSTVRASIGPFMLFLNEMGITNLECVTPKTIGEFLDWAEEVEYTNAGHNTSVLTGFFKWANRHGYRRSACPVGPKFHAKKRPHYLPRPYSKDANAWGFHRSGGAVHRRVVECTGPNL